MASSSSELSAESTSDLATLISKDTINVELLQHYAEKGLLDVPDKDGRTPLMIACLEGLEDTVKFLLANGASPNSKCLKEGNTPMHYACIVEELKKKDALSGIDYNPSKWMKSKIAIITYLVSYGAPADQENLHGWTPPCMAALYMLTDVVDMFLDGDVTQVPLEMKIKVTEILGVSMVTLDQDYIFEDAFDSFSRAIGFRQEAKPAKVLSETSELAACFSKMSLKECHTLVDLTSIDQSEVGLKAHAFLVGDRLFPKKLKQKYLYPSLATFGSDLMYYAEMLEEGIHVSLCALRLGHRDEIKLGLVAEILALVCYSFEDEHEEPCYLPYVRDLLFESESVLKHAHIDSLSNHSDSLLKSFGIILYNMAYFWSTVHILRSSLQIIRRAVQVIRSRICQENPDKYHMLPSVTFKVMDLLIGAFDFHKSFGPPVHVSSTSLLRTKFVICKMLFFESASYQDRDHGNTLLHLLAKCVCGPGNLEHLEGLALAFVRHGCPIDVWNLSGDTARDILEEEEMYDQERYPRLFTLLSPTATVLTLEEMAIRQILQKNISYKGEVPKCLCEMLEGGLKDSDLEVAYD